MDLTSSTMEMLRRYPAECQQEFGYDDHLYNLEGIKNLFLSYEPFTTKYRFISSTLAAMCTFNVSK